MAYPTYTKKRTYIFILLLLGSLVTGMPVVTKAEFTMTENGKTSVRYLMGSLLFSLFKKKIVNSRGAQKFADITNTDVTDLVDTTVLGLYNWAWSYGYGDAWNYLANTQPGKALSQDRELKVFRNAYNVLQGGASGLVQEAYEGTIDSLNTHNKMLGAATRPKRKASPEDSEISPFISPAQSFDWRFHAIANPLIQLISTTKLYSRLISKLPQFDRFVCPKAKKGCQGICSECEGKHIFRKLPLVLFGHHVQTEMKKDFLENWSKTNTQKSFVEQFEHLANGSKGACAICKKPDTSVIQVCNNVLKPHQVCAQCLTLTTYLENKCPCAQDANSVCGKKLTHTLEKLRLPDIASPSTLTSALNYNQDTKKVKAIVEKLSLNQTPTPEEIEDARKAIADNAQGLFMLGINGSNLLEMLNNLTGTRKSYAQQFKELTTSTQQQLGIEPVEYSPEYGKKVLWRTIKDVAKLFLKQDASQLFQLASLRYKWDPWTNRHTRCPDNCLTACHRCKLKSTFRPYAVSSM